MQMSLARKKQRRLVQCFILATCKLNRTVKPGSTGRDTTIKLRDALEPIRHLAGRASNALRGIDQAVRVDGASYAL